MNEKELLEKRGKILKDMDDLGAKRVEEKRAFTKEENEKFDTLLDEADQINRSITNLRKLEEQRGLSNESVEREAEKRGKGVDETAELRKKESVAFRKWMITGSMENHNEEERNIMKDLQKRAQSAGTTTAGGFLIPEGFSFEVDKALKDFGGVRQVARIITTSTGNDIPYPKFNDTGNTGEQLDENTEAAEQDITFGSTTLKAYKYSSKAIIVSDELMQDSAFNIEQMLAEAFAIRIGRITNLRNTTGTGSSQAQGVVTASTAISTTAAAAAISFDDLINLKYGLDPAYRNNAVFMLNDSTLKAIIKLSIGTDYDTPLWQASYREGAPDTILGHKYVINQDMASIGASAKSVLFGDFSHYIIREVQGIWMKRMTDKYALQFSTGFVMGRRESGHYVGTTGNQSAIKHLAHAAS